MPSKVTPSKKLTSKEVAQRKRWQEALVYAVRQHPTGIITIDAANAVGCPKGVAMMLLTQLERDGIIGQRRGVKAIDNHQLAIWLPDASKGREMRPLVKKRNKPSDFTLSKEMEEEQLAWQQAVLKKASTPKINPWGKRDES